MKKMTIFLRFFCALNEAWKVLWFISVILVKASGKWRRSCRKPHFKNDTWFMRRHLQIWLLKHHHNLVALRSSSGQFTLLLPSSQMLSSFLHHWLETWLCLILANEGTNEGRGYHDTACTVFENHRKNLIQQCERSELHLHFKWIKVHSICQKWSIL